MSRAGVEGGLPGSVRSFEGTTQSADFVKLLQEFRPDVILHCAGKASVPGSFDHLSEDFAANTGEVVLLLDQLRQHSPSSRFLLFSSAAVYGRAEGLPISESTPRAPVSPYGFHKQAAEIACDEFFQLFGIESMILRVFSAYGPGLRRQVCWDLSKKILAGKGELVLQGTGEETRDFIHIDDLCLAVQVLLDNGDWEAGIYNVASGVEVGIKDLAYHLCEALGFESNLTFEGALPPGVPVRWVADIERLRALGFQPKFSIKEGIAGYSDWVRAEIPGSSH